MGISVALGSGRPCSGMAAASFRCRHCSRPEVGRAPASFSSLPEGCSPFRDGPSAGPNTRMQNLPRQSDKSCLALGENLCRVGGCKNL